MLVADGRRVRPAAGEVDPRRRLREGPRALRRRGRRRRRDDEARAHAERRAHGGGALVVPSGAHEHPRVARRPPALAHRGERRHRLGSAVGAHQHQRRSPLAIRRWTGAQPARRARAERQRLRRHRQRTRRRRRVGRARRKPVEQREEIVHTAVVGGAADTSVARKLVLGRRQQRRRRGEAAEEWAHVLGAARAHRSLEGSDDRPVARSCAGARAWQTPRRAPPRRRLRERCRRPDRVSPCRRLPGRVPTLATCLRDGPRRTTVPRLGLDAAMHDAAKKSFAVRRQRPAAVRSPSGQRRLSISASCSFRISTRNAATRAVHVPLPKMAAAGYGASRSSSTPCASRTLRPSERRTAKAAMPSRKRLGQTSATPLSSEPLPTELPGDSTQCSSTAPAPTTVASAPTPQSALEIAAESVGSVRGVGCSSKWHRRTAAPPPAGRDQLPPSRVSEAAPSAAAPASP